MSDAEETVRGEVVDEPGPAGAEPAGQAVADDPAVAEPVVGEAAEPAIDGAGEPGPDVVAESGEAEPAEEPDYHDRWLRSAAELDNVRKRARRDAGLAETRGILRLARELLPAIDNLDRALAAAESQPENADHHLTDGIRLVQKEMVSALERVGIVPDSPKGELFDPHRHDAVAQQPVEGVAAGTVVEVYQAGYRLGDEIVRAAKVVVAA